MFKKILSTLTPFLILLAVAGSMLAFSNLEISNVSVFASNLEFPDVCDGPCPVTGETDFENVDQNTLADFIIGIARSLTFISAAVAVLFMVWGGFRYITSNGAEDAGNGKQILINATIGLIISIIAFTIVSVVSGLVSGNIAEGFLN